eukprot:COSAG02_NODE_1674_length_11381_cov_5.445045_8_plen_64_part_00
MILIIYSKLALGLELSTSTVIASTLVYIVHALASTFVSVLVFLTTLVASTATATLTATTAVAA